MSHTSASFLVIRFIGLYHSFKWPRQSGHRTFQTSQRRTLLQRQSPYLPPIIEGRVHSVSSQVVHCHSYAQGGPSLNHESDLRPISLTCTVTKVIESFITYSRLPVELDGQTHANVPVKKINYRCSSLRAEGYLLLIAVRKVAGSSLLILPKGSTSLTTHFNGRAAQTGSSSCAPNLDHCILLQLTTGRQNWRNFI